jgi:mevalonate kinase
MLFKASAPGSLMMLGEYAVLEGKKALVCAINQRINVTLSPRQDTVMTVSSALGQLTTDILSFAVQKPFQFVLTTLKHYQHHFVTGFDLIIESSFSDQMGFGSSAAVTVATLSALSSWLGFSLSSDSFIQHAREIVREVQGIGSGADVAACVLGGVVAYQADPFFAESLGSEYPITVKYSGSKTPTVEAIAYVKKQFASRPQLYKTLCDAIGQCAAEGIEAMRREEWQALGWVMNQQQELMDKLGVNTPLLQSLIDALRKEPSVLGAKISGSGLGDCVVALGGKESPIQITQQGVICEKI